MSIVVNVDAWIVSKCAKFSHWLQRTVGLTSYFVVKVGIFLCVLSLMMTIINYWWQFLVVKTTLITVLFYSVYLFGYMHDIHLCNKNEELLQQGKPLIKIQSTGLPIRMLCILFSVYCVSYSVISGYNVANFLAASLFPCGSVLVFYFLAVTPLPPGTSKLGKLVESISAGFSKMVPVSSRS